MSIQRAVVILPILLALACAHPPAPSPLVPGVYGTLRTDDETGDVLGMRITIRATATGYEATFEEAEGQPSPPRTVPATARGDSVFFQLPSDTLADFNGGTQVGISVQPGRAFRGRVTADGLQGQLSGDATDLLPRQRPGAPPAIDQNR